MPLTGVISWPPVAPSWPCEVSRVGESQIKGGDAQLTASFQAFYSLRSSISVTAVTCSHFYTQLSPSSSCYTKAFSTYFDLTGPRPCPGPSCKVLFPSARHPAAGVSDQPSFVQAAETQRGVPLPGRPTPLCGSARNGVHLCSLATGQVMTRSIVHAGQSRAKSVAVVQSDACCASTAPQIGG